MLCKAVSRDTAQVSLDGTDRIEVCGCGGRRARVGDHRVGHGGPTWRGVVNATEWKKAVVVVAETLGGTMRLSLQGNFHTLILAEAAGGAEAAPREPPPPPTTRSIPCVPLMTVDTS